MSIIPTDANGNFDFERAFKTCEGCDREFWVFDIGRSGLCVSCFEKSMKEGLK